jgi:hypothetical protein
MLNKQFEVIGLKLNLYLLSWSSAQTNHLLKRNDFMKQNVRGELKSVLKNFCNSSNIRYFFSAK